MSQKKRVDISFQLELRNSVLLRWMDEGIPAQKSVPRTITEYRLWQDEDLGIEPIGHTNAVTTTSTENGEIVKTGVLRMNRLATSPKTRPRKKESATARANRLQGIRIEDEREKRRLVSQWHMARRQLDKAADELAVLERDKHNLQGDLAAEQAKNRALVAQLNTVQSFALVSRRRK